MRGLAILGALLAATPVHAEPVAVRVVWNGNDALGGIVVNRVRGLIAASGDKREVVQPEAGLAVIVQTIDPAVEFEGGAAQRSQTTVYALVVNQRHGDGTPDSFGTLALGYCAFAEVASCAKEIVGAIDEEIAKRGLR